MKWTSLAAIVVALAPTVAHALYLEGNDLHRDCAMPEKTAQGQYCLAYVTGVFDTIDAFRQVQKTKPMICAPVQATPGQIVDVVREYLNEHPEKRHMAAVVLVGAALQNAFPCGE